MANIVLVRNDRNYYLDFDVKDSSGRVLDLTGSSIHFAMQRYGEKTLTLDKAGEVVNGTLGTCRVFIEDELNREGEYFAELQITWLSEGKVLTIPDIGIKVLRDLPK